MSRVRRALLAAGFLLATAGTAPAAEPKTAVFAGGCFWCVESDYDRVPGVLKTVSGYTGGDVPEPTYQQVGHGNTGHYESVEVTYDPEVVSYEELVHIFFRTIDPTDPGGQFCDRGDSYRTAIFVADDAERKAAEAAKAEAAEILDQPIATKILERKTFWPAEDYHQNYYQTHSQRYEFYRWGCGRDARIEELWGDEAHMGLTKTH